MTPTRRSDLPNVPWITADGAFDPAKFPIDSTLQQCIGLDLERFRSGCTLLATMVARGRVIRMLVRLPAEIVRERLWELSQDSAFSYKMRAKFKVAAERL